MYDTWTSDVNDVLDKIRINSIKLSNEHKKTYFILAARIKWFRVPVIFLSAIGSVFGIGLSPYVPQIIVSELCAVISMFVGLIGSVELFLAISTKMENELVQSKELYLLSIEIQKTLLLDHGNRNGNGMAYLEDRFNTYSKLIENSYLMECRILDELAPLPNEYQEKIKSSKSNSSLSKTPPAYMFPWVILRTPKGQRAKKGVIMDMNLLRNICKSPVSPISHESPASAEFEPHATDKHDHTTVSVPPLNFQAIHDYMEMAAVTQRHQEAAVSQDRNSELRQRQHASARKPSQQTLSIHIPPYSEEIVAAAAAAAAAYASKTPAHRSYSVLPTYSRHHDDGDPNKISSHFSFHVPRNDHRHRGANEKDSEEFRRASPPREHFTTSGHSGDIHIVDIEQGLPDHAGISSYYPFEPSLRHGHDTIIHNMTFPESASSLETFGKANHPPLTATHKNHARSESSLNRRQRDAGLRSSYIHIARAKEDEPTAAAADTATATANELIDMKLQSVPEVNDELD
uniref:VP11 n=1 Tax=viral metagenome TaxID=1070528 RepID=A0A6C0EKY0_9ZZZZ